MSDVNKAISDMIDDQIGEDDDFDLGNDLDLGEGDDGSQDDDDGSDLDDSLPVQEKEGQSRDKAQDDRPAKGSEGEKPVAGLKKVGNDYVDARGNVTDAQGKILAAAGSDRRHYVEARQTKAENENLKIRLQQATSAIEQAKEFAELPQRLGITPDDYRDALQLAKQFTSDPVAAAKEVVARALALGHNVTDILGADVGNSVDMVALRKMQEDLHNRPIVEQRRREEEQSRQQTAAMQRYNEFISKFPDSEPHEDAIANLMGQGDTAEAAYFKVRLFAQENGLDFTKPLGPQITAKADQSVRPQTPPRKPLGNGMGRTSERRMTDKPVEASSTASYAEIIRGVISGH